MIRLGQLLTSIPCFVDMIGFARVGTGFGVFVAILSLAALVLIWRWPQ
jgi:hypothetical protein